MRFWKAVFMSCTLSVRSGMPSVPKTAIFRPMRKASCWGVGSLPFFMGRGRTGLTCIHLRMAEGGGQWGAVSISM